MQTVSTGSESISSQAKNDTIGKPPVLARKRGKCMTRRTGQNPNVRVGKRANGEKYFFFQYWVDVPGREERKRRTEVIGLTSQMTKSEAERKKLEFVSKIQVNSDSYRIPSSRTFADAVMHYREVFAPTDLRESTFSVADGHLKKHLEPDWNATPIERIDIDLVNKWAQEKRQTGLSWVTIKNILRTMQRVLSADSRDKVPPFSQNGLRIPERDKVRMQIASRKQVSFSWQDAKKIAEQIHKLDTLCDARKEQYAAIVLLASASGLRCGELFALKENDVDFKAGTILVDESSDQRTKGKIGDPKNAAAFRTVLLADSEGREALKVLKGFVGIAKHDALIFHSRRGRPLRATNLLHDGLHPALKTLGLPKAGMHAFRRGCNRRWELNGMNPAVLRQQMGHSSSAMTARYTGEIPLEQIRTGFSMKFGNKIDVLENMENEAAA
jgi:integrase